MFDFLIHADAQTKVLKDLPSVAKPLSAGNIDLFYSVLSNFNYFALAFSIFYSSILFMNFWYWRLFHHAWRLHHEAKGVKSIQDAWWIWARYMICLVLLTMSLSSVIPVMRTIFLFLYLVFLLGWKFREDIIVISETLSQGFGQIGWKHDWPKKLSENLKKLRDFKTISTIKLDGPATALLAIYSIFMVISIVGLTIWSAILP